MRIIQSEFAHDYPSYSFGYTIHAELGDGEEATEAYEAGFLPASSDPEVRNRFYLARSIRVPLTSFAFTSENRRILKKFDGAFIAEILDRETLMQDSSLKPCFLSYFADRHGQSVMSEERLDGILATPLPLRAIRYTKDGAPIAYVLEVTTGILTHYWFSCYDMQYAGTSLGMWLMLDSVRRAKDEERSHLYLGTAYGEKGRYKMNITPLEFWDGTIWNGDEKLLKQRILSDAK